jgi:hypothetical protein
VGTAENGVRRANPVVIIEAQKIALGQLRQHIGCSERRGADLQL